MNTFWTTTLHKTNTIYGLVCGALFLILDTLILINEPSLAPFWFVMLACMGLFLGLALYEYYYLRPRLIYTDNNAEDVAFNRIVHGRNLAFILSVIPFIQILGVGLLVFSAPFYVRSASKILLNKLGQAQTLSKTAQFVFRIAIVVSTVLACLVVAYWFLPGFFGIQIF